MRQAVSSLPGWLATCMFALSPIPQLVSEMYYTFLKRATSLFNRHHVPEGPTRPPYIHWIYKTSKIE